MKPDNVTTTVASLGLLNGSIRIVPAGSAQRPVFECAGKQAYFQDAAFESRHNARLRDTDVHSYLPEAMFRDVRDGVAATLSDMSMKAADLYDTIIQAVHDAGTSCYVVTGPAGNIWPDAVSSLWPEIEGSMERFPVTRLFQMAQLADLLSVDGSSFDGHAEWCAEHPNQLVRTGPYTDGSYRYEGAAGASTASFWAAPVDIAQPWSVAKNPDGSETIYRSVRPMSLVSSLLNLWTDATPGMGWFVAEIVSGQKLKLFRFPDEPRANMFVAMRYEETLDGLKAAAVRDIDPASGLDLENSVRRNMLAWSDPKTGAPMYAEWHIHEGYEHFGLA